MSLLVKDTNDIKTIVVPCAKCGVSQSGTVKGSFDVADEETYGHSGRLYLLAECPGCSLPFLLYTDWAYAGQDGFAAETPAVLYPDPGTHLDETVPASVAESFAATIKTAQAGVPMATAMMCRRTLETICLELGATKFNLGDKLRELKMDPRLQEWAGQVVIELGNDAAHIKADIEADDAQDAVAFTRALIENLFVLKQAFEAFKQRREERRVSKELIQGAVQRMAAEGKP